MSLRNRLRKLEAGQPPITHHRSVVQVPWDIPHGSWHDYLADLPCPCGAASCERKTFGLVVPQRCQTGAEWEQRYAHYREQRL